MTFGTIAADARPARLVMRIAPGSTDQGAPRVTPVTRTGKLHSKGVCMTSNPESTNDICGNCGQAYAPRRLRAALAACAALLLASLTGGPAPASATFPGDNGLIAFTSNRDGNFEIYDVWHYHDGRANRNDARAALWHESTRSASSADTTPCWTSGAARSATIPVRHGDERDRSHNPRLLRLQPSAGNASLRTR